MFLKQRIEERFREALEGMVERGRQEITEQGHVATGRGRASLESVFLGYKGGTLEGAIMAEKYMVGPVDEGVTAAKVPYSGRSGRGGVSAYIQGLIDWSRTIKPGLSDKERKGFAFAVATVAKREGHPTNGSYSFSQNGRRTGWIQAGIAAGEAELVEELRLFQAVEAGVYEGVEKAMEE